MKNLASVLALAAATAVTGCATNPTQQETANNPNNNTPRPLSSAPAAKPATSAGKTAIPAANIGWNDPSCDKDMTMGSAKANVAGASDVCIRLAVDGTPKQQPISTTTSKRADRKAATPTTTPTSSPAPDTNIYTLKVAFSECGVATSNAYQTATNVLGGIADGIGGFLKRGAVIAAGTAAGGGVTGRAAKEATQTATGAATRAGRGAATSQKDAAPAACHSQITNFINNDFKAAIAKISTDYATAHPGYTATYTLTSELPANYENMLKAVVGQPIAGGRAPR